MPTPSAQRLSQTEYLTDGVTTVWNFSFSGGYLLTEHVKAYVEDLVTSARVEIVVTAPLLVGPFQLQVTPALPVGGKLVIYRNTPKDLPLVDFTDESGFTEVALDTNAKQAIFVAAETQDLVNTSTSYDAEQAAIGAGLSAAAALSDANVAAAAAVGASASAAAAALAVAGVPTFSPLGATLVGRASAALVRGDLAAAASGVNADITNLAGLTSPVGLITLRNYIDGLGQASLGASANHSIGIGVAMDRLNSYLMVLNSAITKTTANWAAGSAVGGKSRSAGIAANSSYWWYLIRRQDTGVVDVCFSTGATGLVTADFVMGGGNVPDAYTQWRGLHGWKTDGSSQWVAATSIGDEVRLNTITSNVNTTNNNTADLTTLPSIPVGRAVYAKIAHGYAYSAVATITGRVWNPVSGPAAISGDSILSSSAANNYATMRGVVGTDASARVYVLVDTAGSSVLITLGGWIDTRGKDA